MLGESLKRYTLFAALSKGAEIRPAYPHENDVTGALFGVCYKTFQYVIFN